MFHEFHWSVQASFSALCFLALFSFSAFRSAGVWATFSELAAVNWISRPAGKSLVELSKRVQRRLMLKREQVVGYVEREQVHHDLFTSTNKCHASSNKCLTTSNKIVSYLVTSSKALVTTSVVPVSLR